MRPPRLARALLGRLLRADVRRAALGDLDEEFARDVLPARGPMRARLWYWRQVLGSIVPVLRLRQVHLADFASDLRLGGRRLGREPGFAAAVTLTLAIGIGATTSIFAMTHAVLLDGLPFRDADRLVTIAEIDTRRESSSGNVSYPDFLDYAAQNATFDGIAAFTGGSRTVADAGGAIDRVPMTEVTPGFFALLGVAMAAGRDFTAADAEPGAPPTMILTDAAWRRRFAADRAIVGRTIQLGSQATTVIGVLPAGFEFPLRGLSEIWLPVRPTDAQRGRRYMHWLDLVGRLAPGVDVATARADLDVTAARFAALDPRYHPAARVDVTTLHERMAGPVRPLLLILQGAAAFLLIVACANVASLLIARGADRAQELQVRAAIGAGRGRLVRQLVAESLALALPGAGLGLGIGVLAVRVFLASLPRSERAALPHVESIGFAPELMAAAVGLALFAAAGFGVVPAWQAGGRAAGAHLRVRGGVAPRHLRLQSGFVIAQLALSLALLAGAGLLGRSMHRLLQVSPGFDPHHVLTAEVNGQEPAYASVEATQTMQATLMTRLAALPGATGAATISQLPLAGRGNSGMFTVQSAPAQPEVRALIRSVSDNYFDVMRVPLLHGRAFSRDDGSSAPRVVVVNAALARTVFGGRALGERIAFPFFQDRPWWTIVGVVGDEQFTSLDDDPVPVVYFPFAQSSSNNFNLVLRTEADPDAMTAAVRDVVRQLDPLLPVYDFTSMDRRIAQSVSVSRRRSAMVLLAVFAIAAVGLSAVGLYGLIARTVTQRTRELGIRIALGADRSHVAGTVLRRGVRLTLAGVCAGLLLSALSSRTLDSLLFQVASLDVLTLGTASALVIGIALAACFIPAVRALRIDPSTALREGQA
jgi:predicted permease